MEAPVLWVCCAVAAGAFTQSASGFGLALVAIPLAASVIPLKEAAPVMSALGAIVSLDILLRHRAHVLWREVAWLLALSLPGTLCGVALLHWADPMWLTRGLGLFVLSYSLFALWRERHAIMHLPRAPHAWLASMAGFLAGLFGGATALNGPPVIVYGTYQRWPKEVFKGTLQCFFLFNNILICLGHLGSGAMNRSSAWWIAVTIPALLTGSILGAWASSKLDARRFRQGVLVLSVVVGVSLLLR